MNKLNIIENENGKEAVLCSHFFKELGLEQKYYNRWLKKNIIENDFAIEGVDYINLKCTDYTISNKKSPLTRPNDEIRTRSRQRNEDFVLSLDFAKHLAMQCRTKQGYEVRKYFIEYEKNTKTKVLATIETLKKRLGIYEQMEQIRTIRTTLNRQMQELKTALTSTNEAPELANYQLTLNFN
jgi:anti-repressor protein